MIQMLGRCVRLEAKTPVRQRIVFAAKTIEERVYTEVAVKCENIRMINDGVWTAAIGS
jgi:hypothetical protein